MSKIRCLTFFLLMGFAFVWPNSVFCDEDEIGADFVNMMLINSPETGMVWPGNHFQGSPISPWNDPSRCVELSTGWIGLCIPEYKKVGKERCFIDRSGRKICLSEDIDVSCSCDVRPSTMGFCPQVMQRTKTVHCGIGHYECRSGGFRLSDVCQRQRRSKFSSSADMIDQLLIEDDILPDSFDLSNLSE